MPSFVAEMRASFPRGLPLPPELETTLAWMEATGRVHADSRGGRYASLFPAGTGAGSQIRLCPRDIAFARAWIGAAHREDRLAMFLRTGGDGSQAGLWRDDGGAIHVVHCGSGPGSTFAGVMAPNVIDLLRLLAIGYEELCWPDDFARTPREVWEEHSGDGEPFSDPVEFRAFVERTFGVKTPRVAADIVAAPGARDPFLAWVRRRRR